MRRDEPPAERLRDLDGRRALVVPVLDQQWPFVVQMLARAREHSAQRIDAFCAANVLIVSELLS